MHDPDIDALLADQRFSEELKRCIAFHGHLCPGLTYGYLVATQALTLLPVSRSADEEVVAISENDTCAVDALQVILGTTIGKGNLILRDYGKNVFTVFSREARKALRFSRKGNYVYEGPEQAEFESLEKAFREGQATSAQRHRQKWLKTLDLLAKPFHRVFEVTSVPCPDVPYAPLAPSKPCSRCKEMTMATRLIDRGNGEPLCIPCAQSQ